MVVEAAVWVGAVGGLTLVVLLVICASVVETLLAMLDAPPDPQPAVSMPSMPATVTASSSDRALICATSSGLMAPG